ncbi:hypothetical protein MSG28_005826 [Choristoneura fumiferana]|uniref:Uncharacterized protein n=1 Tax=Choristoneura fumiferana TaxID=7141 RepID=A0ACC0L091_CHOFU|nr:hypothetical protein MSG28_005826 [Choristoneura fumiferana]
MDYISFNNFTYGDNDDYAREAHIMPTPSGAPWNMQGLSWGSHSPPQLVQFNAEVPVQPRFTSIMHCKRKSLEPEPQIPAKIHITEDKMAAHLNGLHLSSDYTTHSLAIDEYMDTNMEPPVMMTNNVREKLKGHTIVLSEELKKLKEEPLIPTSLIERLEKPCMSLVVWQPKENTVEKIIDNKEVNTEEEEPKKRNGVLVPDMGMGMDIEM